MQTSESTQNIFSAIAKMQADIGNAAKNKKGHNYSYADLAQCLEVAKEPLANNDLAVVQFMGMTESGENTLITMLTHSSGEYVKSETIIPKANLSGSAKGNPVQEMGASITYMRRYCLAAALGITQEDSDAAGYKQPPPQKPPQPPKLRPLPDELENVLQMAGSEDELKEAFLAHKAKAAELGYEKEFNTATTNRKKQLQQGAF